MEARRIRPHTSPVAKPKGGAELEAYTTRKRIMNDIQQQAELIRFTLDTYLKHLIQRYPDLLETECFGNLLIALREFTNEVGLVTQEMQQTALSLALVEMQRMLGKKREQMLKELYQPPEES